MSDKPESPRPIDDLIAVMAALRTPGTGCPWDLEQTFSTIAPYTIEEAYEVADAIERGDLAHLEEELGDLLLQVVYHARMAEEQSAFAFDDVVRAITAKMIRRHPHVFGSAEERAQGVTAGFWERAKDAERTSKEETGNRSLLADVPVGLPALTRAVKLQTKAAKVGFDWPSLVPVFEKLKEETAEFEAVAIAADRRGTAKGRIDRDDVIEEYGDMLFVMANIARHLEIDPEAALRSANAKFTRRFQHIETRLAGRGKTPAQSDLDEMDALWDEARAADKAQR